MKTRCPACGATNSLDTLIAQDDAREVLKHLVAMGDDTAKLTMRYLGLFRPAKTELTFRRVAILLDELLPAMQAQRIERNGQVFNAPPEAWHYAMHEALNARETGNLTIPLKSHSWLYAVISKYQPTVNVVNVSGNNQVVQKPSKTLCAIAALEDMKR